MKGNKDTSKTPGQQIAELILENYEMNDAQDVQDAVKQVFAPIFEAMLNGELDSHLGRK